jgi:hypothetical protein
MFEQNALTIKDPAAIAAAETVKARIQSAYMMAIHKPRNEDQARTKILEACKRPKFAAIAEYSKPIGKSKVTGPTVRLAELAIRSWGNILTETQTIYEDDTVRRIRVTCLDLESNASFSKEIQISKTVERRDKKGRIVLSERLNSYGDTVYVVSATDDELMVKEAAMISKAVRNEGLRLIPNDIIDEAMDTARKTRGDRSAKDPDAEKKKMIDAFAGIRIKPRDIEEYLGHKLDIASPSEIDDLRKIYAAIKDGEASWIDYLDKPEKEDDLSKQLEDVPIADDKPLEFDDEVIDDPFGDESK